MKRADWLILLQSLAAAMQVINAGIAAVTHVAWIALLIGGICAAFQTAVQHIGNNITPESNQEKVELKEMTK